MHTYLDHVQFRLPKMQSAMVCKRKSVCQYRRWKSSLKGGEQMDFKAKKPCEDLLNMRKARGESAPFTVRLSCQMRSCRAMKKLFASIPCVGRDRSCHGVNGSFSVTVMLVQRYGALP